MKSLDYQKVLAEIAGKCTFTASSFLEANLFDIMRIQRNEVLICRMLGFLLTPNSSEGIGSDPLRLFLNQINGVCCYTSEELQEANVVLEDSTDNDRRVDIAIYVGSDVYPIEVKVDTQDQPAQLFDYFHYYKNETQYKIEKIYYLCPYRRAPSAKSVQSGKEGIQEVLPENVIRCLSFKEDIWNWLEQLSHVYSAKEHYGFILNQFKDVIKVMRANKTNQEMLYEALGLHNQQSFTLSDEMKVLLNIMSMDQTALWHKVRDSYLRKALRLNSPSSEEKYKLVTLPEDTQIDKRNLYAVKKVDTGTEIAWICVDTNLYIVSKCAVGGLIPENNYYWKHLSPKGTQEFQLRNPNTSILDSDEIDISNLLEQIDLALTNQE